MEGEWLSIQQAARRLDISETATRKRADRGKLDSYKGEDGKIYIWVTNVSTGTDTGETGGETGGETSGQTGPEVEDSALVEQLRSEIEYLRGEVEAEREARRRADEARQRADTIIMELLQQAPQLEPPREQTQSHTADEEGGEEGMVGEEATEAHTDPQQHRRPWWKRLFGR